MVEHQRQIDQSAIQPAVGLRALPLAHHPNLTSGKASFSRKYSVLTSGCAVDGSTPIRTVPTSVPDAFLMSLTSWLVSISQARTRGMIWSPSSVGSTPRPVRLSNRPPHSRSSLLIWRLMYGCVVPYSRTTDLAPELRIP